MQKRKVITVFVLALFASLFLIQFASLVSAQATTQPTTQPAGNAAAIFDPIRDLFANWTGGQLGVNVAKWLLLILMMVIVYSILDLTPFLKGRNKDGLRWIASFIISFLGIAYLTPSDIYAVLTSYNALGFVLSALVPFIVLLYLSIATHKDGGVMGRILSKVIWFAFIVTVVYKLIQGNSNGLIDTGMVVGYLIVLGASVLWVFFVERRFVKWLFREELETAKDNLERDLREQEQKRRSEAKSMRREASGREDNIGYGE